MEEVKDIPIVFTAVTNPVTAGIADSWKSSGRNVTGSSNWIDLKAKLKIFKEGVPYLKKLGVIYNPNNPVPVAEITDARMICEGMGITLKEATIEKPDQIEKAVENLVKQGIDALWVPIEVLVYKNMTQVARVSRPAGLPVVSSTMEGIKALADGDPVGIITMTVDYEALGRLCVPGAVEILTEGKRPDEIPIRTLQHYQICVNANAAHMIGYKIPLVFLVKADKILRGFAGCKIIVGGTGDNQELLRAAAKTLEKKLGGGEIEVPESIGSGGGIMALAAGKIDLARVARPLKKNEKKYGFTYHAFAKSPVVFVVHSSVIGIDNITTRQIIDLYSGKYTKWEQLGAKEGRIYVITREPGDSCLITLNKILPGFEEIDKPTAKVVYSTPEVVDILEKHRKTIGFLPMSATVGTDLRILKVDGVYPSPENIKNGKYQLVVPFGIVCKGEPRGLAKRFIEFLYSAQGKQIVAEYGAVPE